MKLRNETRGRRALRAVLVAAVWLAVWQGIYLAVGQEVLVASPAAVFVRTVELAGTAAFWQAVGASMARILVGYVCAVLLGCAMGTATAFVPLLRALFAPVLGMVRATPVASFIILALIWLNRGNVPVFTSFLMVLPLIWGNVTQGLLSTDGQLLQMAHAFRLPRRRVFLRVYAPSAMPYFVAAATTGMGMAWKAGIAAEVLCKPNHAIGSMLNDAKVYLETTDLFAWTAVVILISIVFERVFVRALRMAGRRYNAEVKRP